jgi:tRNA 2-thiouridine synthesizing protein A
MEHGMDHVAAEIGRGRQTRKEAGAVPVDRELNLKGKICPYAFIESMLALEEMETDQVLRVIVDYPPAVCDVPKSLENEGYEIFEVSPLNQTDWVILVRKREIDEG